MPEDDVPEEQREIINLNMELAKKWAVITESKAPLADAGEWKDKKGKIVYLES
jgi:ferredoxin